MKKFSIMLLGALAMVAASCDDAPEVPPMQSNPQEPILTTGDVAGTAAGVLASTATVNLEDAAAAPALPVFAFTKAEQLPAGASLKPVFELSNTADFAKSEKLAMTMGEDSVFTVNAVEWNDAHLTLFGKSPKVKTAYWRVAGYVVVDGSDYRLGGPDYYLAEGTVNETCMDAGFVIYDNYYLLGNATTWDLAAATEYAFSHSAADVYDDPVFTYLFTVTQDVLDANGGGCYWKIASSEALQSNNWDYVYGPETDGDDNLDGMLVGDGKAQAGKLTEAGKYRLTINMEEMTYSFELVTRPEYVAVPSNANGWNESGLRLYFNGNNDDPAFVGVARVNNTDGGFKFIWDGNWYGGADGKIDAAGGNIPAPVDENALYWFVVSTEKMTYTMTRIENLGIIGDFNSWGAQENLTPSADLLTWTGTVALTGGWKIRMNDNWDFNYGGTDINALVFNGPNITGFDGTYALTVDLTGNAPAVSLAAK